MPATEGRSSTRHRVAAKVAEQLLSGWVCRIVTGRLAAQLIGADAGQRVTPISLMYVTRTSQIAKRDV